MNISPFEALSPLFCPIHWCVLLVCCLEALRAYCPLIFDRQFTAMCNFCNFRQIILHHLAIIARIGDDVEHPPN